MKSLPDSVAADICNQHTYVHTFSFESNGQNEDKCQQNSVLEVIVTGRVL